MAVQLLLCGVLPQGLVQYSSQHSGVIASLFSIRLVSVHEVHSFNCSDTIAALKKTAF